MVTRNCLKCGKEFKTQNCYIKRGGGKYCSTEHAIKEKQLCMVPDCNNPIHGNGYCGKHYSRIRNHGTIDIENVGQSRPGKNNGMYGVHRFGKDNPFYEKRHSD